MKNIKLTIPLLSVGILCAVANNFCLADASEQNTSEPANAAKNAVNSNLQSNVKTKPQTPELKKLFFTQAERERIDKQRQAYLNPPVKEPEKVIAKVIDKPKKKQIYIPPKVEISAVIIKPDGSTIIRVNNKYNQSPSKYIHLDNANTTTNGVPITVNGKTRIVPVGETLLTRQNRLIETYKLNAQTRQVSIPSTEQKSVKNRLDEVKILNSSPTDLRPNE